MDLLSTVMSLIALAVTLVCFVFGTSGILIYLFLRPIIDWGYDFAIFGLSVPALAGLLPLVYVCVKANVYFRKIPTTTPFFITVVICWVLYATIHLITIDMVNGHIIESIESVARISSTFAGYILIRHHCDTPNKYRALLLVLMGMGWLAFLNILLYQAGMTGSIEYKTFAGNSRVSGFSHGIISLRYYYAFALIAAIVFMGASRRVSSKVFGLATILISTIGLYFTFSKSAVLFFLTIMLFSTVLQVHKSQTKRVTQAVVLLSVGVPVLMFAGIDYVAAIFYKEISADPSAVALNGRFNAWALFFDRFQESSWLDIIIGNFDHLKTGFSGGVHNDYLMNLGRYGVIGLMIYVVMIATISFHAFVTFGFRQVITDYDRSKIILLRCFIVFWIIDVIGLHVSNMPVFMCLVFGLYGLVDQQRLRARGSYR